MTNQEGPALDFMIDWYEDNVRAAMAQGGNVAFAKANDGFLVARHACPDGYNPLILELRIVE